MFCIGVYACICVCMYVFFSRMEKMVSDFKHSKSFRGTFITSRVSTTVLQLVLVSLCFFFFLLWHRHTRILFTFPFGTNRCASNLVRPIRYTCFVVDDFLFLFQLSVKLFGTLSTVLSLFCQFYEVVVSTRFICFPACALILIV